MWCNMYPRKKLICLSVGCYKQAYANALPYQQICRHFILSLLYKAPTVTLHFIYPDRGRL